VVDSLRLALGLYGAALAIGFIAGLFPFVSIELFLVGATAYGVEPHALPILIVLGALGNQIARSITYYMGAGVFDLPRGKLRVKIEAFQARIEHWNRRPLIILAASSTIGIPPLYLLGFIAQPILKLSHTVFTAVSFTGRLLRMTTVVVVTYVIRS
jgi:membrane protein YqaA with SNARE-associated domain